MKILIVDDVDANLYLLRVLLLNAGYEVVEAINGKEALDVAAENDDIDLVISDILMPTMDGFEFCRIWKSTEEYNNIPFVFYTATYTEQKDREFALNIGADLFLIKPMESYNLLREVDKILQTRQLKSAAASLKQQPIQEEDYYEKYSSRLVKKLEEKLIQLEQKNHELMRRDTSLRQLNDTLTFQLDKLKLNEASIREHKEELLSIVNSMAEGVITTNERGIISEFNPAAEKIMGYDRKDVVGEPLDILLPEQYRSVHGQLVFDFINSDKQHVVARDMRALHKDGNEVPIRLSVSRLPSVGLSKQMFICTFLDVTKEKQQEKIIARSHKMEAVGALSGGIAHDYNNMLGVILGYSEILMSGDLDANKKRNVENIYQAAERGVSLTRKLLSFSKKSNESTTCINLNDVINDNLDMLNKILLNKIELVLDFDEIPLVTIDKNDFEDSILNLFINAKHAMPEGGKLTLKTESVLLEGDAELNLTKGKYLYFSITDNGCGMPKDVLENVFDPFFTTKGKSGTGLGLSQVYGFVKRSKGSISVESEPGQGTTFHFYFPESLDKQYVRDDLPEKLNPSVKTSKHILVVDDEEALLTLTKVFLEEMGCNVLTANNANEALSILEHEKVDLLLSDVIMPGIDGEKLALRASELYPELKVLLMSGYNEIKTNRFPLIPKPFTNSSLYESVEKVLNS